MDAERDKTSESVAHRLVAWADKLRDISAAGLQYATTIYDRERYAATQQIAMEMVALTTAQPLAQIEALRETLFNRFSPTVAGAAAVIRDDGRILLMRRSDIPRWDMPGGVLEVGETPAEGVVREVLEETGVRCKPIMLVGVYDSRRWDVGPSRHAQQMYKFTFLCVVLNHGEINSPPSHSNETLATGWFAEDDLPAELNEGHRQRIADSFRFWHGDRTTSHFE